MNFSAWSIVAAFPFITHARFAGQFPFFFSCSRSLLIRTISYRQIIHLNSLLRYPLDHASTLYHQPIFFHTMPRPIIILFSHFSSISRSSMMVSSDNFTRSSTRQHNLSINYHMHTPTAAQSSPEYETWLAPYSYWLSLVTVGVSVL